MTVYPYGPPRDAYLNVKEAAKEPWRGITAWVQGSPCLVIDKNDDAYVLENMNGATFTLNAFQKWEPATEHSALVAASRLEGSPFTSSHDPRIGTLVYFENQWDVRLADLEAALPIESLVERYDKIRWSKTADLYPGMDYRCPECGSRDVRPSALYDHSIYECDNCGKQGYEEEFEDEAPDYDGETNQPYASVKTAEGVSSFEYNLPPVGIHLTTHKEMAKAGLQARVHFPPGLEGMFGPIPQVLDVPSNDQDAVMATMMLDDPESHTVRVETPHDPEQVRRLFDKAGGRREEMPLDPGHAGRVAEVGTPQNEPTVDLQEAITCPKCGSHSIRAFSPSGNTATLVCLTCGNEFQRDVHINPQSSTKESASPLDPNMSAQIVGLMQQIEEAYQQGDHNRAQQLHQQMMQLMNNPNQPIMQTTKNAYGPQYPTDPARQAQIAALMHQITEASANGDMMTLRVLRTQLENLMGGNPAYAKVDNEHLVDSTGRFFLETIEFVPHVSMPLQDYQHWNEDAHRVWWEEEGKHPHEPYGDEYEQDVGREDAAWEELYDFMSQLPPDDLEDIAAGTYPGHLPYGEQLDPNGVKDLATQILSELRTGRVRHKRAWVDGMDDPYVNSPQNLDDYTQNGLDPTMQDDNDVDYMHCPACDGPGVLLGSLGNRIHYLCRNCGMHFNEKLDHGHSEQVNNTQDIGPHRDEPLGGGGQSYASLDDVKEVNENTLRAFKDSSGNPVEAGKFYTLHHPKYKVPDVIKILNLEDGRIEASIASDEHGSFPIHITHDEAYSLDPYEPHHKSASGWSVLARKNFSAQEQRELIEENPKGRARNFDKLNLDGTHYQIKEESTDRNFLLGW